MRERRSLFLICTCKVSMTVGSNLSGVAAGLQVPLWVRLYR